MQTSISLDLKGDPDVQISEGILRTCVHCGFCNATCPTYLLTGNELEGPRGRIYLIKSILEGRIEASSHTVTHIDNCLACMACETTCPSGVVYSHLLEDARPRLEELGLRAPGDRLLRFALTHLLPHPGRFRLALKLAWIGRLTRFLLPTRFRHLLDMVPDSLPQPAKVAVPGVIPAEAGSDAAAGAMRVALLTGCAQQVLGPHINDATVRLLTRLGAEVVIPPETICCGALTYHMGERSKSLGLMRRAIEVWFEEKERRGLDAVVLNTSGCGTAIKDYGHIFRNDAELAEKAAAVSALVRDVSEVVARLGLRNIVEVPGAVVAEGKRVAYHDACSLQHGQKVVEEPRQLLRQAGFDVVEVPEAHICCGSAGTYNMLRPTMAEQLRDRKCANIAHTGADIVAAGNIGCIEQIGYGSELPVVHTVELLDWATGGPMPMALSRSFGASVYSTSST